MKKLIALLFMLSMALAFTGCALESATSIITDTDPTNTDSPNTGTGNIKDLSGNMPEIPVPNSTITEYTQSFIPVKVITQNDDSLLVLDLSEGINGNGLYSINAKDTKIQKADGSNGSPSDLTPGTMTDIYYDGSVLETYPGILPNPYELHISGHDGNLVGMYLDILMAFYEEDPGLNGDIARIAFDLTKVHNLTEGEKNALIYVMWNKTGYETFASTFDTLCEEGAIDRENLYWPDGILFQIEDTKMKEGTYGFTFSVSKWRSGLGAIGSSESTAKMKHGTWVYTIGAMWIS